MDYRKALSEESELIMNNDRLRYEIEKLKKKIKIDFGSGYQTDPKTIKFLKEHWNTHPDIFRKNWAPYQKILKSLKQSSLGNF